MSDNATSPSDARPVIATGASSNRSLWIFGGVLIVAGLVLFQALNAHRQELEAPATQIPSNLGSTRIASPPPLAIGPDFEAMGPVALGPASQARRIEPPARQSPQVVTRIIERQVPVPAQPGQSGQNRDQGPKMVFENTMPAFTSPEAAQAETEADRVMAKRLKNPAYTVPQGTVIAAVLETALNSTQSGAARAIVSRDVMSFDGSRVLIPRGSRLYGDYQSTIKPGQNRALVSWHRLTRPDAVIINLDSPAADPLGRAGVEGDVDSHFFTRFGSSILQSVLDIGVGVATRAATKDSVIIAMPGSTANVSGQMAANDVQPTLKVKQGTSVSVFVSKDLDFSTVED